MEIRSRAVAGLAAVLAVLGISSCCRIDIDLSERTEVDYGAQVRDVMDAPVPGVQVTAVRYGHQLRGRGATDDAGRCRLRFCCPRIVELTAWAGNDWLTIRFEKEGYETRVIRLNPPDFVREGNLYTRVEGIRLEKVKP